MDEQARTEPVRATMRDSVEAVTEPRLMATEQVEPVEQLRRMDVAEPVEQLRRMDVAEPMAQLRPMERAEPMEQLRPMERGEPLHPVETAQLRPMERAEPMEQLRPMERGEPMHPVETARLASRDALQPEQAHLASQDALRPTEAAHVMPREGELSPTEGVRRGASGPGLAATRGAAATDPDGGEAAKRRAPAAEQAPQGSGGSGGSAGTGFRVDPAQYQAAVSPLLAAADQLSQLVTGLTAFLDHTQSTAPWGNDESGKKFAEGEKGYLKYSTETLKGLKGMPGAVKYIADGLKAMADNYRYAEDATTDVFKSDGGGEVAAAPQVGTYSAPVNPTIPTGALGSIAHGRPSTHTTGRA